MTVSVNIRREPPHYPTRSPLGVLPEIRRDSLAFMRRIEQFDAPIVSYRTAHKQTYLFKHPEAVRHALQEHVRNYTKEHVSYNLVSWIAGRGLFTSTGDHWLRQRRLAQPAFHRQRIAAMIDMMASSADTQLDTWAHTADGAHVDVEALLTPLTLQIVGQALFGTGVADQAQQVSRNFNELSAQLVRRFRSGNVIKPFMPFGPDRAWNHAIDDIHRVVASIIAVRRASDEDHGDLLTMFMQAVDEDTGERMTDAQLRDEVLTMILAGHETTATTLMWTLILLAQNPDVLTKLRAEVDVFGDTPLTIESLAQLPYTRMVIDESLRIRPPVYILSRLVKADDVVCGYHIPAGSWVDLSPYITHRLPAFWVEPERFLPERFAPGTHSERQKYAYYPFLGGPRLCIGQQLALVEAQIVLARLVRRYDLQLLSNADPVPDPLITLRPKGGLQMRLMRRPYRGAWWRASPAQRSRG